MNFEMNKQKSVCQWVKDHKKGLIMTGIGLTLIAVAGGKYCLNRRDNIAGFTDFSGFLQSLGGGANNGTVFLRQAVEQADPVTPVKMLVDVGEHVRNLPDGYHASPEKLAMALEKGLALGESQTWVESYTRGIGL